MVSGRPGRHPSDTEVAQDQSEHPFTSARALTRGPAACWRTTRGRCVQLAGRPRTTCQSAGRGLALSSDPSAGCRVRGVGGRTGPCRGQEGARGEEGPSWAGLRDLELPTAVKVRNDVGELNVVGGVEPVDPGVLRIERGATGDQQGSRRGRRQRAAPEWRRRVSARLRLLSARVRAASRSSATRFDWVRPRHLGPRPARRHRRLRGALTRARPGARVRGARQERRGAAPGPALRTRADRWGDSTFGLDMRSAEDAVRGLALARTVVRAANSRTSRRSTATRWSTGS